MPYHRGACTAREWSLEGQADINPRFCVLKWAHINVNMHQCAYNKCQYAQILYLMAFPVIFTPILLSCLFYRLEWTGLWTMEACNDNQWGHAFLMKEQNFSWMPIHLLNRSPLRYNISLSFFSFFPPSNISGLPDCSLGPEPWHQQATLSD